jgi:hypothetical protein
MKLQPSLKANSHSSGQETPSTLWNLKIHYRVYKSPLLVSKMKHMDPAHILKISFNNILLSVPKSP